MTHSDPTGRDGPANTGFTGGVGRVREPINVMRPSLHWLLTLLMMVALVPVFRFARLPLRIDLLGMAGAYWLGTASHALFVAVLLAAVGLPLQQTFLPVIQHYRQQPMRLPFLLIFAAGMIWLFGWSLGFVVVVDGIAVAELLDRGAEGFGSRVLDVLIPCAYLFIVVVLVFAYNHAIAGMKFAGSWDLFFNRMDARVFRITVSQVAVWCHSHLSQWFYLFVEYAYYTLYGQVGAALAITAIGLGRREALRYVGTLMTGYALSLVIFYLLPTIGPFTLLANPDFPHSLATLLTQKVILLKAQFLSRHQLAIPEIVHVNLMDYYIGFPSMHITMPLVAIWFLRRWRRMALLLAVFDLFLVVAIVLLEWHYFLDLVGGAAVAVAAIALNPKPDR